jgi:hypothetical protein
LRGGIDFAGLYRPLLVLRQGRGNADPHRRAGVSAP